MRPLSELEECRYTNETLKAIYGDHSPDEFGAFIIPYQGRILRVVASTFKGWDHVSVSLERRIPTWNEMEFIKRLFFKDDEVAFQFHVTKEQYVNVHPNCLHLWRPQHMTILLPPKSLV